MISYIIEVSICWAGFYGLYALLLRQTTFFSANRWYLIGTLLLGLTVPLMELPEAVPEAASTPVVYYLQPIMVGVEQLEVTVTAGAADNGIDCYLLLRWVYGLGVLFFGSRFLYGLWQIALLYRGARKEKRAGYTLVHTRKSHLPFSFLNWLFWSEKMTLKCEDTRSVISHEQAHINGGHSIDILLLEILCVLLWCSPFVYLYRRSLRAVHEYLADEVVLKTTRRKKYGHLLLRQSQSGLQIALANHFFQTQLKQRIMMMTRHKTSRKALIRYLLALPLLLLFLLAFANRELIGQTLLEIHQADGTVLHKEVRDIKEADKLWSPDEIATIQILKDKDLNKVIVRMKGAVTDEEAPADRFSGGTVTSSKPAKPEAGATVRIRTGDKDDSTGPDRILIISPDGRTTELSNENPKALNQFADPDNIVRIEVNKEQGENVIKVYLKEALALPADKGDAPPRFPVYKRVEVMPRFPGCEEMAGTDEEKKACADQKLLQFISENIRYPEAAKEANIEGTVVVQFTIFADGTIGDSKVLRDIGAGAGEEVLRAVKMMPDWTPGRQKGQAVAVQFNLPVRFQLSEEEKANAAAPPAIDRSLKLTSFSASPNPSAGILNLQFQAQAGPTQIRVTDLAGRELLRREFDDFDGAYEGRLDLSRVAKGTVLLIIRQGERIFTEKIVLQ